MSAHTWGHDELANDLAAHIRGNTNAVVWTNMQLGPGGSPRPDVYAIEKTFTKLAATAFEVKVSAADLQRDLKAGKWGAYAKYATTVVFALPAHLASKHADLIPSTCGIIVRSDTGWRYRRRGVHQPKDNLPRDAWLKLVIDGIGRAALERVLERSLTPWTIERAQARKLGHETSALLARMRNAPGEIEQELERHRVRMEDIRKHHDGERERAHRNADAQERQSGELVNRLSLALGCDPRDVISRLNTVVTAIDGERHFRAPLLASAAESARRAAQALDDAQRIIDGVRNPILAGDFA